MRLDQKIAALSQQPLLQMLQPEALHVVAFSANEHKLKAGEELFKAGEASDGGFLVLTGRVRAGHAGDEFGPGSLIGESALFAETVRPTTVLALEPTVLLVLPRSLMHRVLEAHPASALALQARVAAQVSAAKADLQQLV